jgi:hypothetical protein
MARKRKTGRKFQREKPDPTRTSLIASLVDSPRPSQESALQKYSPDEQTKLLEEAAEIFFARRERERLPVLLDRLKDWPAYAWGPVFCENPDLLDSLTQEQRERWEAWRAERERKRNFKILEMPRSAEK